MIEFHVKKKGGASPDRQDRFESRTSNIIQCAVENPLSARSGIPSRPFPESGAEIPFQGIEALALIRGMYNFNLFRAYIGSHGGSSIGFLFDIVTRSSDKYFLWMMTPNI